MTFLEEKILQHINYTNGFYIECGANDGIFQTNTLELETNYDWKGILIEASPTAFQKCCQNRNLKKNLILNCALVSDFYPYGFVTGDFEEGHPMGSIDSTRLGQIATTKVPALTLDSILKKQKIKKVDLFVLDVEGYELEVLKGIDYDYCKPKYLCIEVYSKDKENIDKYLSQKGYKLMCNLTNYNKKDNIGWDGTHQDYLYCL